MTKKDKKEIEGIVEKVLHEMIDESAIITTEDNDEAIIPMGLLHEMEDYMGEPITFMAIS
tara:strand:+ start:331 stop:510 length:180 start_codon:yes stop_codon:yes gene_type:complete